MPRRPRWHQWKADVGRSDLPVLFCSLSEVSSSGVMLHMPPFPEHVCNVCFRRCDPRCGPASSRRRRSLIVGRSFLWMWLCWLQQQQCVATRGQNPWRNIFSSLLIWPCIIDREDSHFSFSFKNKGLKWLYKRKTEVEIHACCCCDACGSEGSSDSPTQLCFLVFRPGSPH